MTVGGSPVRLRVPHAVIWALRHSEPASLAALRSTRRRPAGLAPRRGTTGTAARPDSRPTATRQPPRAVLGLRSQADVAATWVGPRASHTRRTTLPSMPPHLATVRSTSAATAADTPTSRSRLSLEPPRLRGACRCCRVDVSSAEMGGYGEAPWRFTGRALYQMHLVKSEEANKYVPDGLKLVEAFGYTLGGFYLARYSDSPVGQFDELVATGGLVWNPPTSCAWAARVYVNNKDARNHGLREFGLPSRLATFKEKDKTEEGPSRKPLLGWWHQPTQQITLRGGSITGATQAASSNQPVVIRNVESHRGWPFGKRRGMLDPVCTFNLPSAFPPGRWPGPQITVVLPSFSGRTADMPDMIRYACKLKTNVRLVAPTKVCDTDSASTDEHRHPESLAGVLSGRPLIAFAFDNMIMDVETPVIVAKAK